MLTTYLYQSHQETDEGPCVHRSHQENKRPLPPEILSRIFQYLPLQDRKNVRCTCKLWLECCSVPSITRNEVYVFRPGCTHQDMSRILRRKTNEHLNVEFQFSLTENRRPPSDFWEEFGHKIYEINFQRSCQTENETLKNIIVHCVNLTSLKINEHWVGEQNDNMLDYLIENNIKRTRLHTFVTAYPRGFSRIDSEDDGSITVDKIKKFFMIFPCIKNFSIKSHDNRLAKLGSKETISVPIELVSELKSLSYGVLSQSCWLENPIIPIWNMSLTKFETEIHYSKETTTGETLMHFFAGQKSLKIINLTIWPPINKTSQTREVLEHGMMMFRPKHWDPIIAEYMQQTDGLMDRNFARELTLHIFKNCLNLREFSFIWDPGYFVQIMLTCKEFNQFIEGAINLESLITNLQFRTKDPSSSLSANHLLNLNILRKLDFASCIFQGRDDLVCHVILKYSPNVRHIQYDNAGYKDLQNIFKNMPNLESLLLEALLEEGDFDIGRGAMSVHIKNKICYLNQLQRLENLTIPVNQLCACKLRLPNLKHLTLRALPTNELCTILCNQPALESLTTHSILQRNDLELLFKSLECAKNLKCLTIRKLGDNLCKNNNKLKAVFKTCPSLRFFYICRDELLFLLHALTRKVLLEEKICNTSFQFPRKKFQLIREEDLQFPIPALHW